MAATARSLLVRNARIIDGTGAPSVHGDVAVHDGHIAAVGPKLSLASLPAGTREIDARGHVLAPGFIDVHTHFDPQICWDRLATPMLEHGVTTVLMGNRGSPHRRHRHRARGDTRRCDDRLGVDDDLQTEFCMRNFVHVDPDGVTAILSHPRIHIGASDAGAHVAQFCGAGDTGYLLARWVRDLKAFTLEQAVHRLTGELAEAFGIRGRGRIAPGLAADLVLFDPDTIDRGNEEFINDVPGGGNRYVRHATGIDAVVVNGSVTWEGNSYTSARAGTIV